MKTRNAENSLKILVDSSAWLAAIDDAHPLHRKYWHEINSIRQAKSCVVGDYALRELSRRGKKSKLEIKLNSLIWALRSDKDTIVIRTSSEDEDDAWKLYQILRDKNITFSHCLSIILVQRYKILRIVHSDANLRLMINKYHL